MGMSPCYIFSKHVNLSRRFLLSRINVFSDFFFNNHFISAVISILENVEYSA